MVKTPDGRPYTKQMNVTLTVAKKITTAYNQATISEHRITIANGDIHEIEISPEDNVDYYQLDARKVNWRNNTKSLRQIRDELIRERKPTDRPDIIAVF